jgi:pimeloyl-ACP methyl ester carboxylesterase
MMRKAMKILAAVAALLLIAFLVLRTPDTDPAAMKAKYGAAPSQFVDLGQGLTVHLRDEGPRDAPVIVLLHGSNADLHTWGPWADALKGTYRVIRFDTIGHGLTGAVADKDYSPAAMVRLVDRVADKLGLERFVLGGNSMGGAVSALYAIEHPERLSGLVLVDAGGAPKRGDEPGNIGFKIAATPGVNALVKMITPRSIVEKSLRQSVANQAIVTPQAVDRYWELLRYPGNREATMIRMSAERKTFDRAKVATIKVPTLIIWGERDSLIGPEAGRWFQSAIAGSRLIVYPGIGHLPQEEAAGQTVADLQTWLGGIERPARAELDDPAKAI